MRSKHSPSALNCERLQKFTMQTLTDRSKPSLLRLAAGEIRSLGVSFSPSFSSIIKGSGLLGPSEKQNNNVNICQLRFGVFKKIYLRMWIIWTLRYGYTVRVNLFMHLRGGRGLSSIPFKPHDLYDIAGIWFTHRTPEWMQNFK